jgi:hypothetical protein
MLTTVVGTLLPTYLIGAVYGAVANGEGVEGGIALNYGLRCGLCCSLLKHLQIEIFAAALRDTTFVPGATERVVRPLLAAVGWFLFYVCNWRFVDLENPDADIALIKGVPGAVGYIVGSVLLFDVVANPVELWRLYRARNLLLPPAHVATWWKVTAVAGRGTLATALSLSALLGFGHVAYIGVYFGIASIFDKAWTLALMGDGGLLDLWFFKYFFAIALPLMLLAVLWAKPWPRGVRDPVSAVVLCTLQQCGLYEGAFTAFHLYSWLGGPDGSTVGCQILIQVLMLLLYLYARTLARKAFGTAPGLEARTLFMYLLMSDGACQPANAKDQSCPAHTSTSSKALFRKREA